MENSFNKKTRNKKNVILIYVLIINFFILKHTFLYPNYFFAIINFFLTTHFLQLYLFRILFFSIQALIFNDPTMFLFDFFFVNMYI